ncbi:hypothetical protein LWI29_009081 [Acer saccharum]|uniref:Uncharacterized protein n=1 Tax=Acer saccharum TaxID=4024 RepID=A0AA39VWV5_ACESA|nr:hypothetical protein LWI29_009081 [Acer saccharum]
MASIDWNDRQGKVQNGEGKSWGNVNSKGFGVKFAPSSKRSFTDVLGGRDASKGGYGEEMHEAHREVEEMKQVFWDGSMEVDGHQVLEENFDIDVVEDDDLEEEISRVIEIGCDFSGNENFIGKELMRKEKEDERKLRESHD